MNRDHAKAEGYIDDSGALTEDGLEASALGQGPFSLKVVDTKTGETYVIRSHCAACNGYFPSEEMRNRVKASDGWMQLCEVICVRCAGEEL